MRQIYHTLSQWICHRAAREAGRQAGTRELTLVFLNRLVRSAAQRNTVNGRVQILHSMPRSSLIIWMNGLSVAERQPLQTAGKSETSAPLRFMSDLGPAGGIVMVSELLGGRGFEVELRWPTVMGRLPRGSAL